MELSPLLGGRVELDLLAGLIAGFASSLHCLAMCGGVAAAISVNVSGTKTDRAATMRRIRVLVKAQMARVSVYAILGLIAGTIGWGLHEVPLAGDFHIVTRWISALVLVLAAYTVADIPLFSGSVGWEPGFPAPCTADYTIFTDSGRLALARPGV